MAGIKRAFCYTRVSTDQQNTKAQEAGLKDYRERHIIAWTRFINRNVPGIRADPVKIRQNQAMM